MARNANGSRSWTRGLAVVGAGALALHGWRLGLTLLGPPNRYSIDRDRLPPVESEEFRKYLSTIVDAQLHRDTRIGLLKNGEAFYARELETIRSAASTMNLEAYEFQPGRITREFIAALADRARAGVEVRVHIDAIGSWRTGSAYFDPLRSAGGRFAWYHSLNSRDWPYLNNRTHRKLLVVDGKTGFVGGAGFADRWIEHNAQGPRWRDTVLRVEGGAVAALNTVFAENWLESTGEILAGPEQFPFAPHAPGLSSMVVTSTPHSGGTQARILYQALIEAAAKAIHITTPYFVPDRSARKALLRAAHRGVTVKILTAGPHSDHAVTRRVSRLFDGALAKAGAAIYEYQPGMIHAKLMTVDGVCTVAGSTNFDHRSFDLNDEVNIVVFDRGIAEQADRDFIGDLEQSRKLTTADLQRAGIVDRAVGDASWVLRREQ
jgi:cardiolipin synthase A/B